MVRNIISATGALLLLGGCDTLDFKGLLIPTGPGVEKRFEQSMEMTSGNPTSIMQTSEEYEIYVCTDPHIDRTSRNLNIFNDALRNDSEASFGIILGDCIDRKDNLAAYIDATTCSKEKHEHDYPIFHILGNHDVYFNGWEDFREEIGPSVYWFEARFDSGADLYISLDSATGTLGGKQTRWLKTFLADKRGLYRHCFILTHTNLFYTDNSQISSGNLPMEETLALVKIFSAHKVTLVLQGHDHYRDDQTYDKVRYTVLGAIADKVKAPEYLKIKVDPEGASYEWVKIEN